MVSFPPDSVHTYSHVIHFYSRHTWISRTFTREKLNKHAAIGGVEIGSDLQQTREAQQRVHSGEIVKDLHREQTDDVHL